MSSQVRVTYKGTFCRLHTVKNPNQDGQNVCLIWIQTVSHPDGIPERIFPKSWYPVSSFNWIKKKFHAFVVLSDDFFQIKFFKNFFFLKHTC